MAQIETEAIVREVRIAARPETIFEFLTDPAKMTRWMGKEATLDPRPGGIYRVDVNGRDVARGEFVDIEPPARVVFTWGWEQSEQTPPGSTTVEISLLAEGDETILRLVHRGLASPDSVKAHDHGWEHYLARLTIAGTGGDPGPDPWLQTD